MLLKIVAKLPNWNGDKTRKNKPNDKKTKNWNQILMLSKNLIVTILQNSNGDT